jgi:hypothetical protein
MTTAGQGRAPFSEAEDGARYVFLNVVKQYTQVALNQDVTLCSPSTDGKFQLRFWWRAIFPAGDGGCAADIESENNLFTDTYFGGGFAGGAGQDSGWQEQVINFTVSGAAPSTLYLRDTITITLYSASRDACEWALDAFALTAVPPPLPSTTSTIATSTSATTMPTSTTTMTTTMTTPTSTTTIVTTTTSPGPCATGINYIPDPSFEDPSDSPWSGDGAIIAANASNAPFSFAVDGAYYFLFQTSQQFSTAFLEQYPTPATVCSPSSSGAYVLRFWWRELTTFGYGSCRANVQVGDSGLVFFGGDATGGYDGGPGQDSGWTEQTVSFTQAAAPGQSTALSLLFAAVSSAPSNDAQCQVAIDAVTVVAV